MYILKSKLEAAHNEGIWCCAWGGCATQDNEYIITGSLDNSLKVWKWNLKELKQIYQFEGHRLGVISVDINSSGTMAVSNSLDNQIIMWDLKTGNLLRRYEGNPSETWTVVFSPDSRFIATGSHTGCVNVIDVQSLEKKEIQFGEKFVYGLAYSSDGTRLAAGTINGIIIICDLKTGDLFPLEGHTTPVRSVAFSSDGNMLASASDDKLIKIFDTRDGRLVAPAFNGHKGWVVSVDFCPNKPYLVSGSTDSTVRIWDLRTKSEDHCFTEHKDQVWCTRYNPNGNNIISVGDDRSICVYDG